MISLALGTFSSEASFELASLIRSEANFQLIADGVPGIIVVFELL
jgi:hypothetical protein